ncbi:MAG: TIGR02206 family membrane protein [Saprospiraceae bacterium]|nr:TIGR02206 family membrane protein [Saprospiraceae bacterium]
MLNKDHFLILFNSSLWWYGFIGFLIYAAIILFLGKKFIQKNKEPQFRRVWLWVLIARELVFYFYLFYSGKFTVSHSLPLHLCGLSYLASMIFLYKPKFFYFEFLLLLGIGGAVQSIYTPEVTGGYSAYFIVDYYISHGTIIITPLYAYFVLKMQLRDYSWIRIWILAHVILISVGCVNYFLNSNYIYLCEPPAADNPFITGGYPYHLLGFEVLGTIHILLFYVIFKYGIRWKLKPKFYKQ